LANEQLSVLERKRPFRFHLVSARDHPVGHRPERAIRRTFGKIRFSPLADIRPAANFHFPTRPEYASSCRMTRRRPSTTYRWANRRAHAFRDARALHGKVSAGARVLEMPRHGLQAQAARAGSGRGPGAGAGNRRQRALQGDTLARQGDTWELAR